MSIIPIPRGQELEGGTKGHTSSPSKTVRQIQPQQRGGKKLYIPPPPPTALPTLV